MKQAILPFDSSAIFTNRVLPTLSEEARALAFRVPLPDFVRLIDPRYPLTSNATDALNLVVNGTCRSYERLPHKRAYVKWPDLSRPKI